MGRFAEKHAVTIQEFPLSWRWTDARYTVFPCDVLAQLYPCDQNEVAHDRK